MGRGLPCECSFDWCCRLCSLLAAGCAGPAGSEGATPPRPSKAGGKTSMSTVHVRVIGPDGKLGRAAGVAPAGSLRRRVAQALDAGAVPHHPRQGHRAGLLRHAAGQQEGGHVRLRLLQSARCSSRAVKFESGTGWPSFFQPAAKENIREADATAATAWSAPRSSASGAARTSGTCSTTGRRPPACRYCLNSAALRFVAADQLKTLAEPRRRHSAARAGRAGESRRPAGRGGLRRRLLLVRRGRLPPTRRRAGRHQRLCRRHRRHGQLRGGLDRTDRPRRGRPDRLRSAEDLLRAVAQGPLRHPRSHDAEPPGQRRRHAVSLGHLLRRRRSRSNLPRR